jgi:hypothetical protein
MHAAAGWCLQIVEPPHARQLRGATARAHAGERAGCAVSGRQRAPAAERRAASRNSTGAPAGELAGCAVSGRQRAPSAEPRAASRNSTGTPASMRSARKRASQLVSRTQPWDVAYPIVSGALVPWMP